MDTQKRYTSDLSDKQWRYLRPHIPEALPGGRHRSHDMRSVVNAILYRVKNGCIWQDLPHDFPPHQTVYELDAGWHLGKDSCGLEGQFASEIGSLLAAQCWNY